MPTTATREVRKDRRRPINPIGGDTLEARALLNSVRGGVLEMKKSTVSNLRKPKGKTRKMASP